MAAAGRASINFRMRVEPCKSRRQEKRWCGVGCGLAEDEDQFAHRRLAAQSAKCKECRQELSVTPSRELRVL